MRQREYEKVGGRGRWREETEGSFRENSEGRGREMESRTK